MSGYPRHAVLVAAILHVVPAIGYGQTLTAVWDPNPEADAVSSYQVCVGTSSYSCNSSNATIPASQTSYTFAPGPGILYYVAVRALSASGDGPYSAEVTTSIPSLTQPANQTSIVNNPITPFRFGAIDPDGSSLQYSHSGLPFGLTLDSSDGVITGTPTSTGVFRVTLFVSDGLTTVSRSFDWTVLPPSMRLTGLTANLASPQTAGTTITFTPTVSGGSAPYEFKWFISNGAEWTTVRDWSGSTSYSWTPPAPNASYRVGVWARSAGSNDETGSVNLSIPYPITSGPPSPTLRLMGISSNVTSPQAPGTAITFTATASGGGAPYQFKWFVFNGSTWAMVKDWSTSAVYIWTSPAPNANYRVGVWARSAGSNDETGSVNLSIPYPISSGAPTAVLRLTGISSNLASPGAPGTAITFTATASGGGAPYQFKWFVFDGSTWAMVKDWSTSAVYIWTPGLPNVNYRIGVWARSAGSNDDTGSVNLSVPYPILP
jgi:hypothetical protein